MKILSQILFLLTVIIIFSVGVSAKNIKQLAPANNKYIYEILENKNKTFGYKIIKDGKTLIVQESIPALPGNSGFAKKLHAEKLADLVIRKINQGIMPPTVSIAEVDSVRALIK